MSLFEEASIIITPNGFKAGKLYAVIGADLNVSRATSATRVNANGVIETMGANVPLIDHTGGGCPTILVQPQRTNVVLYSEQFNNAYWATYQATISENATASPDTNVTSDKLIDSTSNDIHANYKGFVISSESTLSYFVKSAEYSRIALTNLSDGGEAVFNLSTGTVVSTSSTWKNSTITALANGWFKISATTNGVSGSKAIGIQLVNNSGALSFAGTGSSGLYIWGAQLEAGSYATSYIPTTSASVTRNADVISKTGISDLIGQTEGTIFVDIDYTQNSGSSILSIFNTAVSNSIFFETFNNILYLTIITSGALVCQIPFTTLTNQNYKIAVGYKLNDIVFYVNGNQAGVDTNATIPATNEINLGFLTGAFAQQKTNIKAAALWKTRLSNEKLAELTTI